MARVLLRLCQPASLAPAHTALHILTLSSGGSSAPPLPPQAPLRLTHSNAHAVPPGQLLAVQQVAQAAPLHELKHAQLVPVLHAHAHDADEIGMPQPRQQRDLCVILPVTLGVAGRDLPQTGEGALSSRANLAATAVERAPKSQRSARSHPGIRVSQTHRRVCAGEEKARRPSWVLAWVLSGGHVFGGRKLLFSPEMRDLACKTQKSVPSLS